MLWSMGVNLKLPPAYELVIEQIRMCVEGFKEIYSKPPNYEDEYGFTKNILLHTYMDQANSFADDALRIKNGN